MQFNVAQLLREPIGSRRFYELDEPDGQFGAEFPRQRVTGQVELLRTRDGILVRAEVTVTAHLECSRCLAGFLLPLRLHIEEEFYPEVDVWTGFPLPLPPGVDPTAFRISPRHILDLAEAVRQYATLALPIQPLCREACAGLCPLCGADRNVTACGCQETVIDQRWAALAGLKETSQERS